MNNNFEDTAKKYKDEMLKIYQQQKSKPNNQQANSKNQKNNNNQQANDNFVQNNRQNNKQNNAQPNQNIQPPTTNAPMQPLCPGTQVIPPVMPVNLNNNQPNAPMQNNRQNNNPNNAQPNQNNIQNNNQQFMNDDEEYVPPTRPRCPASQPIPPVIPANMPFNNKPIPSTPNNTNSKFGQWNNPSPNNNSTSNIQSPSPPPSPFQRSIPVQLTPDQIPIETPNETPTPNQNQNQNQTQPQEIDLRSIFEEIFPEPILPPFPVGETGGEYIAPTEEGEVIELPPDIDTGEGQLKVITRTASDAFPVKDAVVIIERVFPDGSTEVISSLKTNASGVSPTISLPAPPKKYSLERSVKFLPFSYYDVLVSATGFYKMIYKNVPIFDQVQSVQPVDMIPVSLDITNTDRIIRFVESGE